MWVPATCGSACCCKWRACPTAWNNASRKRSWTKHFEAFSKKHYDRILDPLEIDEEALKGAIDLIVHLNPKPGNTSRDTSKPVARDHPGLPGDGHRRRPGPLAERTQRPGAAREPRSTGT